MILFISPSSLATRSVSSEVKLTVFQLSALIFHFLFLFIGYSTWKGLDLGLHIKLLAHCTDYYCVVGILSKLHRLRFYVDL